MYKYSRQAQRKRNTACSVHDDSNDDRRHASPALVSSLQSSLHQATKLGRRRMHTVTITLMQETHAYSHHYTKAGDACLQSSLHQDRRRMPTVIITPRHETHAYSHHYTKTCDACLKSSLHHGRRRMLTVIITPRQETHDKEILFINYLNCSEVLYCTVYNLYSVEPVQCRACTAYTLIFYSSEQYDSHD